MHHHAALVCWKCANWIESVLQIEFRCRLCIVCFNAPRKFNGAHCAVWRLCGQWHLSELWESTNFGGIFQLLLDCYLSCSFPFQQQHSMSNCWRRWVRFQVRYFLYTNSEDVPCICLDFFGFVWFFLFWWRPARGLFFIQREYIALLSDSLSDI